MELVDWCKTTPTLSANSVTSLVDYYYQDTVVNHYKIDHFTSTMPFSECPLLVSCATLTSENALDFCTLNDSLTSTTFLDFDLDGIQPKVTYDFESDDNVNLGTQLVQMEITATQAMTTITTPFNLNLIDPCEQAFGFSIDIAPTIVERSTAYRIYPQNLSGQVPFDSTLISYPPATQLCRVGFMLSVEKIDSSPIDPNIFAYDGASNPIQTLTINTEDRN